MVWNYIGTSISRDFWEHDLLANGAFWLTEKWLKHFSELPKQCPIEPGSSVRCEKCSARKSRKEKKEEERKEGGESREGEEEEEGAEE